MNLRLTDEESDALRRCAEETGRSMQDIAREAIRDYVRRRIEARAEILARIVREDRDLLDLLAK
jgi:predicted transcriptional regulator